MQQLIHARQMQKDFLVTDVACKELSAIGYNCLIQIKKMQSCSFISTGEKKNEAKGLVKITFNSDNLCRQLGEIKLIL